MGSEEYLRSLVDRLVCRCVRRVNDGIGTMYYVGWRSVVVFLVCLGISLGIYVVTCDWVLAGVVWVMLPIYIVSSLVLYTRWEEKLLRDVEGACRDAVEDLVNYFTEGIYISKCVTRIRTLMHRKRKLQELIKEGVLTNGERVEIEDKIRDIEDEVNKMLETCADEGVRELVRQVIMDIIGGGDV